MRTQKNKNVYIIIYQIKNQKLPEKSIKDYFDYW